LIHGRVPPGLGQTVGYYTYEIDQVKGKELESQERSCMFKDHGLQRLEGGKSEDRASEAGEQEGGSRRDRN